MNTCLTLFSVTLLKKVKALHVKEVTNSIRPFTGLDSGTVARMFSLFGAGILVCNLVIFFGAYE